MWSVNYSTIIIDIANAWHIKLPGRTVKVELLLKAEPDEEKSLHRTVVPLFTDVAGMVRVDCTVPEDKLTPSEVIPRLIMPGLEDGNPSTSHVMIIQIPAQ